MTSQGFFYHRRKNLLSKNFDLLRNDVLLRGIFDCTFMNQFNEIHLQIKAIEQKIHKSN